MCLISIAGIGLNKYSQEFKDAVRHGTITQKDGTGFAYWRHGTKFVHYEKGFVGEQIYGMGYKYSAGSDKVFDKVWARLEALKLTEKDILVIHHRSSTSGTDEIANCHPFALVSDLDADIEAIVRKEGKTTDGVLFHNGVFDAFNDTSKLYSDTARVTDYLFTACPENIALVKRDSDRFEDLFADLFKGQKVVILEPKRCIFLGKAFITTLSGYKHSNMGYSYDSRWKDIGGKNSSAYSARDSRFGYNEYDYGYDQYEEMGDSVLTPEAGYEDSFDPNNQAPFDLDKFESVVKDLPYPDEKKTSTSTLALPPVANIKDRLKAMLEKDSSPSAETPRTIADIKREFSKNITESTRVLKDLLTLAPDHVKNLFFYKNGSDNGSGGFESYEFFCTNLDFNEGKLVTLFSETAGKVSIVCNQKQFFSGYFMAPKPGFYSQYMTYIQLVLANEMEAFSGKALKYLLNMERAKPSNGQVTIMKPFKAILHIDGIKMFNAIHGKDGLKEKLVKKVTGPKQTVLIPM